MQIKATASATFVTTEGQGTAQGVEILALFYSLSEAQECAAQFPKSYGVKASLYRNHPQGYSGAIVFRADLRKSGVNGGKNETGISRYRKTMAKMEKLGIRVTWDGGLPNFINTYRTREAFEAAL